MADRPKTFLHLGLDNQSCRRVAKSFLTADEHQWARMKSPQKNSKSAKATPSPPRSGRGPGRGVEFLSPPSTRQVIHRPFRCLGMDYRSCRNATESSRRWDSTSAAFQFRTL